MASFFIKAGYDGWRKQILNVSLEKTQIWESGSIFLSNNYHFWKIRSDVKNQVEIIKNNNNYALVLNNMIVYENPKIFDYDIKLLYTNKVTDFSSKNLYDYLDYNFVNAKDIYTINNLRQLN